MAKKSQQSEPAPSQLDRFKPVITVIIVMSIITGVFVLDQLQKSKALVLSPIMAARSFGDPNARVKIIEFIDFSCPRCAQGAKLLKHYRDEFPYDMFIQVKYYPHTNRNSMLAALYAECAARQDSFWSFYERLFEEQERWLNSQDAKLYFLNLANSLEIDTDQLEACSARSDIKDEIVANRLEGESNRIFSTPAYLINGELVVGPRNLESVLSRELGFQ